MDTGEERIPFETTRI